jgi:hypothetical protein
MSDLDRFFLDQDEPNKSCFLTLRDIILNHDSDILESKKYGMPCFTFKNKVFCYLWTDKLTAEPYILFVEGKYLSHPALEHGSRKRMKILPVHPTADIQIDKINLLLSLALNLYKDGTISIK